MSALSAVATLPLAALASPSIAATNDSCSWPDLAARFDRYHARWCRRRELDDIMTAEDHEEVEKEWDEIIAEQSALARLILDKRPETIADVVLQARAAAATNNELWTDTCSIEDAHSGLIAFRRLIDRFCEFAGVQVFPDTSIAPIAVELPIHPDHALLELGNALEAAWAVEREAWRQYEQLDGKRLYAALRATLAYDADSAVDRHIVSLLESETGIRESETAFLWIHVERLRGVGNTGDRAVDQRVQELIAAHEQWDALSNRPEVDALISQGEAAAKKTGNFAEQIEDVSAVTIDGL
jgi:hypothetical protein